MKTLFSRINVTRPSEEELILRINPILSYVFALAFIALALLLFLFSITTICSTNLTCNKSSFKTENISCKLSSVNLLGIGTEQTLSFSNVPQAAIVEDNNKEINQAGYRAILRTNMEEIVLARNPIIYHYNEWQQNIIQLNKFIKSDNTESLIVEDKNYDVVLAGFGLDLFFAFVIIAIWIGKTSIICTISHESETLLIEHKKPFDNKTTNYLLKNIEKVFLETKDGMDITTNRITFKLNTGDLVPTTSYYDSFSGKKEAVRDINQFIK